MKSNSFELSRNPLRLWSVANQMWQSFHPNQSPLLELSMKKILLLLSLSIALDRASAFPFFDPFEDRSGAGGTSYTVGSDLGGQSDGLGNIWNSIGTSFPGTHPIIAAGNLSYTNLPASSGNGVSFFPSTTGQQSARLNFNYAIPASTTRAYYSFKLKLTDITGVPTAATNN